MLIDIHSHVVPTDVLGKAGKYGPEIIEREGELPRMRIGSFSYALRANISPEAMGDPAFRIAEMDKTGRDMIAATIAPPFYLYNIEHDLAITWAESVNDSLFRYCSEYPDRMFVLATLPLRDMEASLRELERVRLIGAKGVNMGRDPGGRSLADPYFHPLYAKLEELELPIFLHPLALGQESDSGDAPAANDDDFNPRNWSGVAGLVQGQLAGYIYQETAAIGTLMLGGVLDDFPTLKVCVSHGGGAFPFHFGRFQAASELEAACKNKKPLTEYLSNFYFDIIVHDLKARKFLLDFMGPDNLIFGSNFPGWDANDSLRFVEELNLDPSDAEKILSGNAVRIFHL